MYSFQLDPHTGILRAKLHGHWTQAVAERYSQDLEHRILKVRRDSGFLKLIIDATEHGPQMPHVIDYVVARRIAFTREPTDRVAICTASPLGRRLVERYTNHPQSKVFSSLAAARVWLMERGPLRTAA